MRHEDVVKPRWLAVKPKGWQPGLMSTPWTDAHFLHNQRVIDTALMNARKQYALAERMFSQGLMQGFDVPAIRIKELRDMADWHVARAHRLAGG